MSMAYIRLTYGVPAKRGGRVEYEGRLGTITRASHYLRVRLDGDKVSRLYHPLDLTYIKTGASDE